MEMSEVWKIAKKYLKDEEDKAGVDLEFSENIIEEDDFVVLYYNSKKYMQTRKPLDLLLGIGPIIISKKDGKIYETGTAYPDEHYIENFRKYGDPHATQEKIGDDYKPIDDPRVMTKKEVNDVLNEINERVNKKF